MTEQELAVMRELAELGKRAEALMPVVPEEPEIVMIPSGGDLQAALNFGGTIHLTPGGVYESEGFVITESGTTIIGNDANLISTAGSALYVPPGVNDINISDVNCTSPHGAVIQLGDNSATTQGTLELVPRRIKLTDVRVPTHRSKRGFEINAADVELINCEVLDTWSTALADSQGIGILNTPGNILVRGGRYQAASENVLVGGDTMKLPGVIPSNLVFENLLLDKPLSWKTDGVRRSVKNIFELKTGSAVTIRNVHMDGCWKDGQDGYALMITPKSGGLIETVLIEGCTIRNVSAGINILGKSVADAIYPTNNIVMRNCTLAASKTVYGGRGILTLLTGGVESVYFENITAHTDGDHVIYGDSTPMQEIVLTNCRVVAGRYGVSFSGYPNAASYPNVANLVVRDNVIAGAASTLQRNLPNNTYVTRAEFDAQFPLV